MKVFLFQFHRPFEAILLNKRPFLLRLFSRASSSSSFFFGFHFPLLWQNKRWDVKFFSLGDIYWISSLLVIIFFFLLVISYSAISQMWLACLMPTNKPPFSTVQRYCHVPHFYQPNKSPSS